MRLNSISNTGLLEVLRGSHWRFAIRHLDGLGNVQNVFHTRRVVKDDMNRALGEGFLLRNVRVTDKVEILLLLRFAKTEAIHDPWRLGGTVRDEQASQWTQAFSGTQELHRYIGGGGHFTVLLKHCLDKEEFVLACSRTGLIKPQYEAEVSAQRHWISERITWALAKNPLIALEICPLSFYSASELSLLHGSYKILDAPVFRPAMDVPVSLCF